MPTKSFTATIEAGRGGGALIAIPFDVEKTFGTKGRVPITATFDGHPYRGSLAPMGGRHVLGILKAIREKTGKGIGDTVRVTLERDTSPRTVDVPQDLAAAFRQHPDAKKMFDGLAYTSRKECARWIESAKRPETRARRVEQAVAKLRMGEKL